MIGDFKHEYNHWQRHSALGCLAPAIYAAVCAHGGDAHTIRPACSGRAVGLLISRGLVPRS